MSQRIVRCRMSGRGGKEDFTLAQASKVAEHKPLLPNDPGVTSEDEWIMVSH